MTKFDWEGARQREKVWRQETGRSSPGKKGSTGRSRSSRSKGGTGKPGGDDSSNPLLQLIGTLIAIPLAIWGLISERISERDQIKRYKKEKAEELRKYQDALAADMKFLAENAQKEGVNTLPSGTQYKEITAGNGWSPSKGDEIVVIRFKARSIDGKIIPLRNPSDYPYSIPREEKPSHISIRYIADVLREPLQLMSEKAKWLLFVPPNPNAKYLHPTADGNEYLTHSFYAHQLAIIELELISFSEVRVRDQGGP